MTKKECDCGLATAKIVYSLEKMMNRIQRGKAGISIDPFYIGLSVETIKQSAQDVEYFCGLPGFVKDVKANTTIIDETISHKTVLNENDLNKIDDSATSIGQTLDSKLGGCAGKLSSLYQINKN